MDARAGGARREREELAHPSQARRGRPCGAAERLPADARDAHGAAANRRRVALRGQVGRVPRARVRPQRRREARQPQRQRSHCTLPRRRAGARASGPFARLRRRRRGVRTRRQRAAELLGDAAGQARHADRLRGVRRPRDRRRTRSRPAADRSAATPRAAARPAREDGAALGGVRRRPRAPRRRDRAEARRRDGEARRLALSRGQAHARLAEDQDARRAGVRDRRLHEGRGPARPQLRLARARGQRGRGAALGRQCGDGLHGADDHRAARCARAAARRRVSARRRPEDAARPQGRRRVGASRSSSPR